MPVLKKTGEGLLLAGIFFLLFLLLFEDRIHLPLWLQVAGRMHPMFLHFPITLLLVYFVTFWIPLNEASSPWVTIIGFIAAFSAIITAIMGLLLSLQETQDGAVFFRHKWGGVSIALLAFLFYFLHSFFIRKKNIGRPLTIAATVLVLITGHWGGDLTHGENYLLQPFAAEKKIVPLSQAIAYGDIIQPLFQRRCAGCHNDGNSKGGLSLSDTTGMLKGGKTAAFFIAGDAVHSLFLKRISLPAEDKKHMPPNMQLPAEELQLLHSWVKAGAPLNKKIISLPEKDSFLLLASRLLQPMGNAGQSTYRFAAAGEKIIRSLNNNYRVVTPLDLNSPALEVQFYGSKAYTSKSLEELLPVKQQIVTLGLAKMPVKDNELKIISQMSNLQKLNINYTDITDEGIVYLHALKELQEITLSGTAVTAKGMEQLVKLASVKEIFVWNTTIDSNKINDLQKKFKKVKIETGYRDEGQDVLPLNPPVVKIIPGVYDPPLKINMSHPLKGVEIRYTIDGSDPDSIHSTVYNAPLELNAFTVIRARAFKPKWLGSKTMKAVYFMKGLKPDSVSIVSDERENINKGKILFDLETGDVNVGSGKWLGLKKTTSAYMFFKDPVLLHKIALNMFVDVKSKMFLPAKMEVWGGMDKNNMKLLKTWKSKLPLKEVSADLVQPIIDFAEMRVKCIGIIIYPFEIKKADVQSFISEIVLE